MNLNKEILKRITSIVALSLFLVFSTVFVFIPNSNELLAALSFMNRQGNFYVEEVSKALHMKETIPMHDEDALDYDGYTFKVVNNTKKDINYQIVFKNNKNVLLAKGYNPLDNNKVRYNLDLNNSNTINPRNLTDEGIIYIGTIKANSEDTFNLKMWIDWEAGNEILGTVFQAKINIEEIEDSKI